MYSKQSKRKRKENRENECTQKYSVMMEEVPDEEMPNGDNSIMIEGEGNQQDQFQGGQSWNKNPEKSNKSVEEIVPEKYHEYLSVFKKKESERMPLQKLWDHSIEM